MDAPMKMLHFTQPIHARAQRELKNLNH